MPLFIRQETHAHFVDHFYAAEAETQAEAEAIVAAGAGQLLGREVGMDLDFLRKPFGDTFLAGSRPLPPGIALPAAAGALPFNPLLRRIVIESVVLVPHADLHLVQDRSPYRILLEANEGDLSPHAWAHRSRIAVSEDVPPSRLRAELAAIGADPAHYDELVEEEAEGAGFVATQVGEGETVWMQADEPNQATQHDTALAALIAIEHDVAKEPEET